jgi:large subunit ribosomal protein L19
MSSVIKDIEAKFKKKQVVDARSGDTVKVHQKVKEGSKERIQIFEGLVIRTDRKDSLTSTITVRRLASGIGVEKSFLLHSPTVTKVEVVKRSKVRRNYLSYMRKRSGKSARLASVVFDKSAVNDVHDAVAEAEEVKLHEDAEKQHEVEAAEKAEEDAKLDAKAKAVEDSHKTNDEK